MRIQVIHRGISSQVNGLAVDWISGNIYWTDALYNWIMLASPEERSNNIKVVVRPIDQPHGIVLHPSKGLMFWVDAGLYPKIERATLFGEDRRTILNRNLNRPSAITLDLKNDRLYWVNQDSINTVKIDGSDRKILIYQSSAFFVGITYHNNFTFVTDRGNTFGGSRLWFYQMNGRNTRSLRLRLPRTPYGIINYRADRQPFYQSHCTRLQCSQICMTISKEVVKCACRDGYTLMHNNRTCQKSVNFDDLAYIYSFGKSICVLPIRTTTLRSSGLNNETCFSLNSNQENGALDFNFQEGAIYFSETKDKQNSIRKFSLTKWNDISILINGTGIVKGMAVDWLHSNIYWTDSTYGQILVSRLDGTSQKILISYSSSLPNGIVVHPLIRKIFWTNSNVTRPSIMTAYLDGSEAMIIIQEDLIKPSALTIDRIQSRIYWIDQDKFTIESCDLDGRNRKVSFRWTELKYQPHSLTIFQDYIAFTNKANNSGLVFVENGIVINTISHLNQTSVFAISTYDKENQPLSTLDTGCTYENGGCEQLCLLKRNGYTCACVDGMVIDRADNRTCIPKRDDLLYDNFFLLADQFRHQIYLADTEFNHITALKLAPEERPVAFDYEFRTQYIYWSDNQTGVIKRTNLNGTEQNQIIRNNKPGSRISGLAFDSNSQLLYFTDFGLNRIGVMNPIGTFQKILIKTNIRNPSGIVLDSRIQAGHMYYISNRTIERANLDGSNRLPMVTKNVVYPTSVAIDLKDNRLYFCDAGTKLVESIELNGSIRRVVTRLSTISNPLSLTINAGFVYLTDRLMGGIKFASTRLNSTNLSAGLNLIADNFFRGHTNIKFYHSMSSSPQNSCSRENGQCSHFCFYSSENTICGCPDFKNGSVRLTTDRFNCADVPTCILQFPNGRFEPSCASRVGSSCSYMCDEGFENSTITTLKCLPGLQWSASVNNLCRRETCDLLPTPSNSAILDENCRINVKPGATCMFSCNDNFIYRGGSKSRVCLENGNWSGTSLICQAKSPTLCPPLDTPRFSTVSPQTCEYTHVKTGFVCIHRCKSSFIHVGGNTTRICQENGTFSGLPIICQLNKSPAPCYPLNTPAFATVSPSTCKYSHLKTGFVCTHRCKSSFIHVGGNTTRTCQENGKFSGQPIVCQSISTAQSQTTLIVCLVIGLLFIFGVLSGILFFLYRRYHLLPYNMFKLPSRRKREDELPVVDESPVYDVATGTVYSNGRPFASESETKESTAFENPGYKSFDKNSEFNLQTESNEKFKAQLSDNSHIIIDNNFNLKEADV